MPEVTLYTQAGCGACIATKAYLDRHSLPYSVIDVTSDEDTREALRDEGWRSMPVLKTNQGDFSGYRPGALKALRDA